MVPLCLVGWTSMSSHPVKGCGPEPPSSSFSEVLLRVLSLAKSMTPTSWDLHWSQTWSFLHFLTCVVVSDSTSILHSIADQMSIGWGYGRALPFWGWRVATPLPPLRKLKFHVSDYCSCAILVRPLFQIELFSSKKRNTRVRTLDLEMSITQWDWRSRPLNHHGPV